MLAHWYGLLLGNNQEEPPEEQAISVHGIERRKERPQRDANEVDAFSNWPIKQNKNDDEECLILLMM